MQVIGLDHYNICGTAEEIREVRDFYCKVLGFTEGFRPGFGIDGSWLYTNGHALLHLTIVEDHVEKRDTGNLHHIALRCQGLEEMARTLTAHGVSYHRDRVESLGITQLFIHDPAGVRIELSFAGE